MKLKFKVTILTVFIIFLIGVTASNAYAENLTFEVNAGFNGKCKIGYINPVKIEVQASEANIDGKIILSVGEDIYEHNVKIVQGTKKTYIFPVLIKESNQKISVKVNENRNVICEKQIDIKAMDKNAVIFGILSEEPNNYMFLNNVKTNLLEDKSMEVVALNKDYLLLECLNSINFIIVDNFNSSILTKEQQKTINDWTKTGGILFVGNGKFKHKNITGIFEDLNKSITLGKGKVVLSDIDISEKSSIKEIGNLIETNISAEVIGKLNNVDIKKQAIRAEKLRGSANNMLKVNFNMVYLLISIIIMYILILGIVIYFKKTKAYAFIISVISFSAIFLMLYLNNGIDKAIITSASINDYETNGNYIKTSFMNIYPYKKEIAVKIQDALVICNQNSKDNSFDSIEKTINIKSSNNTNNLYNIEFKSYDRVENSLSIENDNVKGSIKNKLPYELNNAALIIGDSIVKIGYLDVEEEIKVDYKLEHNLRNMGDYEYTNFIMSKASMDKYEKEIFQYYFLNSTSTPNYKLIGFSKGDKKVNVNEKNHKIKDMSLEVLPVKLNYKGNDIELHCGLIQPILNIGQSSYQETKKEYTFNSDEEIKVHYIIPSEIKPSEIMLDAKLDEGKLYIERFNYSSCIWEKIEDMKIKVNENSFNNKILTLKIKGQSRIIIPQITIKGTIN